MKANHLKENKMKIKEIKIRDNRRKVDDKKIIELSESIKELGLLNPITVSTDGTLIAGKHRLEAYKLLGYDEIKVNIVNLNGLLAELAEIDENLIRNELHWLDADKQLARRKSIYEELHPETKSGGDRKSEKSKRHNVVMKTFTEDAADKVGVNARTVQRSVKRSNDIVEDIKPKLKELDVSKTEGTLISKQEPEIQKKIVEIKESKKISVTDAIKEIKKNEKKAERLGKIEEIKTEIAKGLKAPNGLYDVIAIDPPWEYSERGGSSSKAFDDNGNRGGVDYPTMTVNELKNINIPCKDDSVIYLWTTHAFLRDAFDLLDFWGYKYKATIVWDKVIMGMGRNIRMQVEFCLLATKGKPILDGSDERDIITEARRQHSRKPESFYTKVENMTAGYKLDYFAREQREGWFTYGAEDGKF